MIHYAYKFRPDPIACSQCGVRKITWGWDDIVGEWYCDGWLDANGDPTICGRRCLLASNDQCCLMGRNGFSGTFHSPDCPKKKLP